MKTILNILSILSTAIIGLALLLCISNIPFIILGDKANAASQSLQSLLTDANNQLSCESSNAASTAVCAAAYASDQTAIAAYYAQNPQNASQVNYDQISILESNGYNFQNIQQLMPGGNWTYISTQYGINCNVQQNQVNWNNWTNCENNYGENANVNWAWWGRFYCRFGVCG